MKLPFMLKNSITVKKNNKNFLKIIDLVDLISLFIKIRAEYLACKDGDESPRAKGTKKRIRTV